MNPYLLELPSVHYELSKEGEEVMKKLNQLIESIHVRQKERANNLFRGPIAIVGVAGLMIMGLSLVPGMAFLNPEIGGSLFGGASFLLVVTRLFSNKSYAPTVEEVEVIQHIVDDHPEIMEALHLAGDELYNTLCALGIQEESHGR